MVHRDTSGVLVIDKPGKKTSAQIVATVKRILSAKRVGHTGTLDPMATGVLPIVVGDATKIAGLLLAQDKAYEGEFELGVETDSLDADGAVTGRATQEQVAAVSRFALAEAMATLTGLIAQVPPMVSALRYKGKRLYALARQGIEVEREPRRVHVDRFELLSFDRPRARFVVECQKGTYVRALVRDVGHALGCGAALVALRRTRAGAFWLEHAVAIDADAKTMRANMVPAADALAHLPRLTLADDLIPRVLYGQAIDCPEAMPPGTPILLLTSDGQLLALARKNGNKFRYMRVFPRAVES